MRPKELQITVSRTLNLGNYESLRIEAGMAASVDDGDNLDEVREKILAEVTKSLSRAYKTMKSNVDRP